MGFTIVVLLVSSLVAMSSMNIQNYSCPPGESIESWKSNLSSVDTSYIFDCKTTPGLEQCEDLSPGDLDVGVALFQCPNGVIGRVETNLDESSRGSITIGCCSLTGLVNCKFTEDIPVTFLVGLHYTVPEGTFLTAVSIFKIQANLMLWRFQTCSLDTPRDTPC